MINEIQTSKVIRNYSGSPLMGSPNRWIYAGAVAPTFGTLHSATSFICNLLGERASKRND